MTEVNEIGQAQAPQESETASSEMNSESVPSTPTERLSADHYKRQLEAVCNNATLAFFIMDEHQQCSYMNPAAEKLTGFRLEEVKGRALHNMIHHTRPDGSHYPLEECPIDQAFPQNNQEQGEEVFVHKDGHFYPVAYTASPIREGNGIVGTIIEVRDITQEKRDEQARRELEQARTSFFSNVSHEFRTPLTLMLSPLEDLLANSLDLTPHAIEQLEMVQRNGTRLLKLVNTLLNFSQIEAGRVQATYAATDLAAFTAELASVFRSLVERAGLALHIDCPTLPESVYVDREMWEKIVLNLLSNAFKFTFHGSITVRLRLVNDRVELSVEDTGTGIPTEELPRLFERFHRVEGAHGRSYEGSGIGLSLVQELVKLHGGTISAERNSEGTEVSSAVNQGTRFTVQIPTGTAHLPKNRIQTRAALAPATVEAKPYVEEALRWLPDSTREDVTDELGVSTAEFLAIDDRPPARILLADDNADMRDYVKRLLSAYYEVETVSDGATARAIARQHCPDLILSDVMMPGLDGFALLRQLREDPATREVPVILLSARAGQESRLEGLEAGADDYLTKPFSARELLARVEATLKLSRLRQEATQREQTLRIEAEAARQQTSEILECMTDAFIALDRDWRITYINDAALRLNSMSREEVVGKSHWEVWAESVGTVVDREYRRAIAEQIPVHFENFYEPYQRWFEIHAYPSSEGLGLYFRDISDRKTRETALEESEARYRFLIESIPHLVWTTDAEGSVNYANQQCLAYLGVTVEQLGGEHWLEIIHPDDRAEAARRWSHATHAGNQYEFQNRIQRNDGEYRWFLCRAFPMRDESGSILQWVGTSTDIDDAKRAEERLHQQALVFEHLYDGVVVTDAQGRIVEWNRGAARMYGYSEAEVLGQTPALWHRPVESATRTTEILTELRSRGIWQGELHFVRKDGSEGISDVTIVAVFDPQGTLSATIGINHDITERKQTETTLRESEERYRYLAESIPQLVWTADADGALLDVNQRWSEFTGLTVAQARAQGWQAIVYPDDIPVLVERWTAAQQNSSRYEAEGRMRRSDGVFRWYLHQAIPMKNDVGQIIKWFGSATDIEDRKQSEQALHRSRERLKLALKSAQMGLWDWNLRTGTIAWTDHDNQLWGMSPETFDGRYETFEQQVYPDDRARIMQAIEAAIAGDGNYEAEFRIVWADGSLRWIAGKGKVFYDDRGQAIRMISIVRDITPQQQAMQERERLLAELEEALQREQSARAEAERANRVKDEFLAVLSHELRTPLNPILGWSKLLQTGRLDAAKTSEALATIERNAKLQTQLIDDLLDVSRILRGKMALTIEPVNLAFVIQAAQETVRLAAEAKGIEINAIFEPMAEAVLGDAARLQQVIWNLLSNAVKFTPEKGRVEVRLTQVDHHAQIQVTDTGKGISSEFLPFVFDYFRQADSATTRKFGGLGLGLAIVRQIVELHGGTVAADSLGDGQGATFTVKLPLQSEERGVRSEEKCKPASLLTPLSSLLSGCHILVVDDEPDSLGFTTCVLEQAGAEVTAVGSAIAALHALTHAKFDLLVSDIGMPEVDGYDLMRQLRAMPADQGGKIPAIALTAYAGELDQHRSHSVGFQQHLAKPVDPEALILVLANFVQPLAPSATEPHATDPTRQ